VFYRSQVCEAWRTTAAPRGRHLTPGILIRSTRVLGAGANRVNKAGSTLIAAAIECHGAKDLAHATCAEWGEDFVRTEPCAGREAHGIEVATKSSSALAWRSAVNVTSNVGSDRSAPHVLSAVRETLGVLLSSRPCDLEGGRPVPDVSPRMDLL
jgi:hypothetical protein